MDTNVLPFTLIPAWAYGFILRSKGRGTSWASLSIAGLVAADVMAGVQRPLKRRFRLRYLWKDCGRRRKKRGCPS